MDESERQLFGRRRRRNAPAGESRDRVYRVYVSSAEDEVLKARAAALDATVPRLLFEAATSSRVETSTERKALIAELFTIRRLLASVANNTNQLAKFANTEGSFPAEAEQVLVSYRELVPELEGAVRRLAQS